MIQRFFTPHTITIICTAIIMAFISAKFLFHGSVMNTIPWGILAFCTAFIAVNKREAWKLGAVFGFTVSYAFLWFDNTNIKSFQQVMILIPLVLLPSLFGALCGFLVAWLGWVLRQAFRKK